MIIANWISYVLVLVGALNWGLVGIFDYNLVSMLTGGYRTGFGIAVYIIILLAAIWLIVSPLITNGKLLFGFRNDVENK